MFRHPNLNVIMKNEKYKIQPFTEIRRKVHRVLDNNKLQGAECAGVCCYLHYNKGKAETTLAHEWK